MGTIVIESGFGYLSVLLFTAAVVVQWDKRFPKISKHLPGIVVLYFLVMSLSTLGLWKKTDEINFYYKQLKENLLSVMIFLMLLRCDLRRILKLGARMLLGFFSASFTIAAGFIVTYFLLKSFFVAETLNSFSRLCGSWNGGPEGMVTIQYSIVREHYLPQTWKTFAALCGSWMGGTGNMAAIQGALHVDDAQMGYTLLIDSIDYAIWVMLLLAFVPFSERFNRWTGADTKAIDEVGAQLKTEQSYQSGEMEFHHLFLLIGFGFAVSALSTAATAFLPTTTFFTQSTWSVLIATVAGVVAAMTPLGKTPGISLLANLLLYTIVALIASRANFGELTQAPLYIFAGFLILLVHAVLLALIARIFKLDLFTCGVASLANIGGVASAPILAAAYSEVLIPIGVLMSMMGYIIGTGGGLLVGKILSLI